VTPLAVSFALEVLRPRGYEGHEGFMAAMQEVRRFAKKSEALQEAMVGFTERFGPPYASPAQHKAVAKRKASDGTKGGGGGA
jgi:hypothetical protein